MKYLKKEKRPGAFWKGLLVIVLMAAAFVGGVYTAPLLGEESQPTETTSHLQQTQPEETTATDPVETQPSDLVYELRDGDIVASTPYGEVHYTAEFAEFISVTHEFSREQYAVHFDAALDTGISVRVFSVYFAADTGRQPDGVLVNTIQDADGTERLVIVTVAPDFPDPAWDVDLSNLAYAMLEGVSDTMEQLTHME